jgi:VCBS repeat-containing protein
VLYAGEGNDAAYGGRGNDVIFGEGGNDALMGNSGNDIVMGGSGSDFLFGDMIENNKVAVTSGSDYLDGGEGDDTIYGNEGDDILIGGKDTDTLFGGLGQDTYIYNVGDGIDYIYDTKAENNIIRFGAGVDSKNVKLHLGSLMLDLGNGDAIHIEGIDQNDVYNSSSISGFEFADGTSLSISELLARGFDLDGTAGADIITGTNATDRINGLGGNDILIGMAGDDILSGGADNDIYYINSGDGKDTIIDAPELGGNIIQFGAGINAGNTQFLQQGADLLIKYVMLGNSVLVKNFAPIDLPGEQVITQFQFADGSQGAYVSDGLGNASMKAFDNYGWLVGEFWQVQSGAYGNNSYYQNGSTSSTNFNLDGSYSIYTNNGMSDTTTTNYDAAGSKLNDTWTKADGSYGSDIFNSDGSSTGASFFVGGTSSTYTNDGQGNTLESSFNALGIKTGDSWTKSDGSHGTDVYNSDGSSSGVSFYINGTSSTYTNDGVGNTMQIFYQDSSQIIKTGDSWIKADGSHGSDVFNSDGSSYGTLYTGPGMNTPHSSYTIDSYGNTHTISYEANGNTISDIWNFINGNYGVVIDDGLGNVTTTIYSPLGSKLGDSWIKADGSYGNDNFNSNGSSSGIAYHADGSYSAHINNGLGQVITKNYSFNGSLTGTNTTETHGLHNVISSFENSVGAKISESWIHSDGSTGKDLLNTTALGGNYGGGLNLLQYSGLVKNGYAGFWNNAYDFKKTQYKAYSNGNYVNDAVTYYTDTNSFNSNFNSNIISQAGSAKIAYEAYNNKVSVYFQDDQNQVTVGVIMHFDASAYDVPNPAYLKEYWSQSLTSKTTLVNDTKWFNSEETPVTQTILGFNGSYSTFEDDGQGNLVYVAYNAQGVKLKDMWIHNDGANGGDTFNVDGSRTGYSAYLGKLETYTDDGQGHVVITKHPLVMPIITIPPEIFLPTAPFLLNAISSTYTKPTFYTTVAPGFNGDNWSFQWWSDGSVVTTHYDAQGNKIGNSLVQTDPGFGADITVDGKKSGWTYDVAGIPTSWYSEDGLGNITTFNYDAKGHITGSSVATAGGQGGINTLFYDATGQMTGNSTRLASGPGQITTTTYNAAGQLTGSTLEVTDGLSNTVTSSYDSAGVLLSLSTKFVNSAGDVVITTYDANKIPTSVIVTSTDSENKITTHYYDASGKYAGSVNAIPDGAGNITTSDYDATGALMYYIKFTSNAQHDTIFTTYDAYGIKIRDNVLHATGVEVSTTYQLDGSHFSTMYQLDGSYSTSASDGLGKVTTTHFSAQQLKLNDTWQRADGSSGTNTYNADGTVSGTAIYADGTTGTITNNGQGLITTQHYSVDGVTLTGTSTTSKVQGNLQTINYDAGGTKYSESWVYANGASGNNVFNPDGSKASDSWAKADGTYGSDIYNADGSHSSTVSDVNGITTTTIYDAGGTKLSDSWFTYEATAGGHVYHADGSYSSTVSDAAGTTTITNFNASGMKLNDSWTKKDGSYGNDIFNGDGSSSGVSHYANGNYSDYFNDGHGAITTTDYDVNGYKIGYSLATTDAQGSITMVNYDAMGSQLGYNITTHDGLGGATTTYYDTLGIKLNDKWTKADGTWGDHTFNANGTSSGTSHNLNGSYSKTSDDVFGNWITYYYDIKGQQIGDSWTSPDGSYGSDTYSAGNVTGSGNWHNPDGSYATYTFADSGKTYSELDYDANGVKVGDYWNHLDGSSGSNIYSSDGSSSGNTHLADGSYSTYTNDGLGNIHTSNYDAAGTLLSDSWTHANRAPLAGIIAGQVTNQDAAFTFKIPAGSFTDPNANDTLTYTAKLADGTALPDWLHFDANTQTFSGTAGNADVGGCSVTVTATDTSGLSASSTFAVNVANINDAPTVTMTITAQATLQDAVFNFTVPAGTFNDVDFVHGDKLTYTATLADGTALPGWMAFDAATQSFSGTAGNADVGNLNVLVTATDTGGLSVSSAFALNIINVNDGPTANADTGTGTAIEDSGAVLLNASTLMNNDTDPDFIHGDVLNMAGVSQAVSGAAVSLLNGNVQYDIGKLYQSLAQGQTATDTFSYTVSDLAGATSTATVSMTITGVNDAAVAVDDTANVLEDGTIAATGNVLANDSDIDQGTVLTAANAGTLQGNYGNLVLNTEGGYSYLLDNASLAVQSLAAGQVVTETFTYQASDGIAITPATLIVTITGTNDAPVTIDDAANVQEDLIVTATGNVLTNDSDVDQGTVLTVANAGTFAGTYGQLVLNVNGSYSYALNNSSLAVQSLAAGQVVTEVFAYQATDGMIATPSTLAVTITGTNDAPVVAIPLSNQTATETGTFTYRLPANTFTDIDQGDVLTYTATMADGTALPAWLAFDASTLTFSSSQLADGTAGLWDITVTAKDTSGASVSSGFTLDVANLIKGTCEENVMQGTALRDVMYGLNDDDLLRGYAADDVLVGGSGNDVLEGGAGNDTLIGGMPAAKTFAGAPVPAECIEHIDVYDGEENKPDNNLLNGGAGNDTLIGGAGNDLLIGGSGNDIISTGTGADIIAFNKGDGRDTVLAPSAGSGQSGAADDTLSLGGGIKTSDLAFRHLGNDLVLETGAGEQITFSDWYASSSNHSILNLQIIDTITHTDDEEEARNAKFDFGALVGYFDRAVTANGKTDHWALTNALLNTHLEQSSGSALGGDLAYQYGNAGSLTGVSLHAAQDVMESAAFGTKAQELHEQSRLKEGVVMLG